MVNFGEFLKTWSLLSNSVTRQVTFYWTKNWWKMPNFKTWHFWWFSNTMHSVWKSSKNATWIFQTSQFWRKKRNVENVMKWDLWLIFKHYVILLLIVCFRQFFHPFWFQKMQFFVSRNSWMCFEFHLSDPTESTSFLLLCPRFKCDDGVVNDNAPLIFHSNPVFLYWWNVFN